MDSLRDGCVTKCTLSVTQCHGVAEFRYFDYTHVELNDFEWSGGRK